LFLSLLVFTHSDTIDKKKILAIIKAAKQHKAVPNISKSKIVKKQDTSPAPIVVYKKRTKPVVYYKREKTQKVTLMQKEYGTLPSLVPSSIALREKFQIKNNSKDFSMHFKTPMKKNHSTNTINTVAKKISF